MTGRSSDRIILGLCDRSRFAGILADAYCWLTIAMCRVLREDAVSPHNVSH